VHDVEQKTLLLVAPIIGVTFLAATPLVAVFFDANVALLAATIIWMVSSYLLCSLTVTPFYQFLMAKGHASRTVVVQVLNVVVNTLVFFATFSTLGYFAAVAGNVAANGFTWLLLYWYQRKFLDIGILDNWRQAGVILLVVGIPGVVGVLFPQPTAGLWGVLLATVAVGALTVVTYRASSMVSVSDVARYLGEGTRAARFCIRVLCKSPSSGVPVRP
jgi:O-antigen/teichoic acid export membrane protein